MRMAKMEKIPERSIIDGLFGVIDFYELHLNPLSSKTIAIARAWPTYNKSHYPESCRVTTPFFGYVGKMWNFIEPEVQEAYKFLAGGTSLTGRDYMTRGYMNWETL
jgi:hypothetical protein